MTVIDELLAISNEFDFAHDGPIPAAVVSRAVYKELCDHCERKLTYPDCFVGIRVEWVESFKDAITRCRELKEAGFEPTIYF